MLSAPQKIQNNPSFSFKELELPNAFDVDIDRNWTSLLCTRDVIDNFVSNSEYEDTWAGISDYIFSILENILWPNCSKIEDTYRQKEYNSFFTYLLILHVAFLSH